MRVKDTAGLAAALRAAEPGDVIALADGTYRGPFSASTSGTAERPIWLCGGPAAVLDGGSISKGYVLHLNGVAHWRVLGITLTNGQKGLVGDAVTSVVLQDLTVRDVGDEGIHLRATSTGNAVLHSTISGTGLRRDGYGEGVYIGSGHKNWEEFSGGQPDRSDHNLVVGNTISRTGAESVDVKEGTTGGVVADNTFDGTGMSGADSWVDVKGNDWLVEHNTGRGTPSDGYQSHELVDGWGTRNVFRANAALGTVPGEVVHLAPVLANRVQ